MFLLVSLIMLGGFAAIPSLAGERALNLPGIVTDLLLLPHADAILSISWSLRHEVLFYLLFITMILWGWKAAWLIILWGAASFMSALLTDTPVQLGLTSLLWSPLNIGFALGLGAGYTAISGKRPSCPRLMVTAGIILLALLWLTEWYYGRGTDHSLSVLGPWGDLAYLSAATLLITGLVTLEPGWRWRQEALWGLLGGASYTLYLIHQPLGSVIVRLLRPIIAQAPLAAFLAAACTAIFVAIVLHLTVEKWMMSALHRLRK